MEKNYNFLNGQTDSIFRDQIKKNPVYLDENISMVVEKIASQKGVDRSTVVNEFLRKNIRKVETMI